MPRRPRHLSTEEKALWDRVAKRTEPLKPQTPAPEFSPTPKPKPAVKQVPIPQFQIGERAGIPSTAAHLASAVEVGLRNAPLQMDAKTHGRMKQGKLKPEARIDLHGMTLAEAHPALLEFILTSERMGRRLVLVITGKGRRGPDDGPIPARIGQLRHQVPGWLRSAPLASVVLQVTPAHGRHGGLGAYYVYLRRKR